MEVPPTARSSTLDARVVAFDLDNTLIDIVHLKRRAAEAAGWALADAGMDIHPGKAATAILGLAFELGIDRDDIVDHYIERKLGRPDPRLAAVGRHAYERAEDANATSYPRAHATLLELTRRGYRLALITDAPRHKAVRRLQSARLLPFFETLITLEDTGDGKSTSRPYEIAAARLATRTREIAMVGDNPQRDVRTARAAGCHTILAAYGLQAHFDSRSPQDQADHRIQWLDQLLSLLPPRESHESALTPRAHARPGRGMSLEAAA